MWHNHIAHYCNEGQCSGHSIFEKDFKEKDWYYPKQSCLVIILSTKELEEFLLTPTVYKVFHYFRECSIAILYNLSGDKYCTAKIAVSDNKNYYGLRHVAYSYAKEWKNDLELPRAQFIYGLDKYSNWFKHSAI